MPPRQVPSDEARARLHDLITSMHPDDAPAAYRLLLDYVARRTEERRASDRILDEDNE